MTSPTDPASENAVASDPGTAPVQRGAGFVGVLFIVLGIAGFIPGVTAHFDQLQFAGPTSAAEIVHLVRTSVMGNLIHLLTGVLAFVAIRRGALPARNYLFVAAGIYFLLFVYGLNVSRDSRDTSANFWPVNDSTDFLHLVLVILMLVFGIFANRTSKKVTSVVQAQD